MELTEQERRGISALERAMELTEFERRVLRALERATVEHRNPSMAEIGEYMEPKRAPSSVRGALVRLSEKGYVELSVRRARGIRQLEPTPRKSKSIASQ